MSDADNVVVLDMETTLDLPPERILNAAIKADLETVLVIGWDKEGDLYAAGSTAKIGDILLLLERTKQVVLSDE